MAQTREWIEELSVAIPQLAQAALPFVNRLSQAGGELRPGATGPLARHIPPGASVDV